MSDLDTLFPDKEVKLSGGESIVVRPFFFGQFPHAIRLLRPITDAVRAAGIASFDGKGLQLSGDWPLRIPQLMDEAGESLLEFVAFATGKQRVWFDTLPADDGVTLTKAVFEANASFFAKRIAPLVGLAVQPQSGEPSSSDSSTTAMPEAASTT